MKSFKTIISELTTSVVRPPFFILSRHGMGFVIIDEIITDDQDVQRRVFKKYKDCFLLPGREAGNLKVGDTLNKRQAKMFNALPIDYFMMEATEEELTEVAAKKKVRVLKGKRVVQYRCPPGHHKRSKGGRTCVRTTGKRKYKVTRGAKRGARKRKARKATISRRRSRSVRKRRSMGL